MASRANRCTARSRGDRERGASATEVALLFPLLIALVLGIAEVGWMVDQRQDIRHNAHDAARLAALDFGGTMTAADDITEFLCDRFDLYDDAEVEIMLPSGSDKGDPVDVYLGQELEQLTGMFGQFFGGKAAQSTGTTILETNVSFSASDMTCGAARGNAP